MFAFARATRNIIRCTLRNCWCNRDVGNYCKNLVASTLSYLSNIKVFKFEIKGKGMNQLEPNLILEARQNKLDALSWNSPAYEDYLPIIFILIRFMYQNTLKAHIYWLWKSQLSIFHILYLNTWLSFTLKICILLNTFVSKCFCFEVPQYCHQNFKSQM